MGSPPSMKLADWESYSTRSGISGATSAGSVYTKSVMADKYNPLNIALRESRDSENHPKSTPIIIGLDVTGSMQDILLAVAKKLGPMVLRIIEKQPVSDPQVMFNAIGDSDCHDDAPLQVTQFESDIRIAEQLTDLYFEGGGGGNGFESYPLTWYMAANKTSIDSFEKRGKKGYIFTIGDDGCPKELAPSEIKAVFGDIVEAPVKMTELLNQVNRQWEVFHIDLSSGARKYVDGRQHWKDLLGERFIEIERRNYEKIPELIVSLLETMEGHALADVVKSWDGSTGLIVGEALKNVSALANNESSGLVEFN